MQHSSRSSTIYLSLAIGLAISIGGCAPKSTPTTSTSAAFSSTTGISDQAQYRKELLQSALSLLKSSDQYDDETQLSQLIAERLNQWRCAMRAANAEKADAVIQERAAGENRDPLIDTLPKELADTRWVRRLNNDSYDPTYDGIFLLEAMTLRDVAGHVEADKGEDPLSVAQAIFDWTVRNIQLEPQPTADATPAEKWLALHLPIDTLFYGRGTPLERAWVFMLLARQAGLDVVLLATPDPREAGSLRPWVTALVSGDQLYLFDFAYGLPIQGPDGKGISTLAQAAADDAILRQMDIPGDRVYPRKASDLQNLTALIEASPGYLEPRMRALELQLSGHDRAVLSTSPAELAAKLRDVEHVGEVKLWAMPYETLKARSEASPELQRAAFLERLPFTIAAEPEEQSKKSDETKKAAHRTFALRVGRLLYLRGLYGETTAPGQSDSSATDLSEVAQRGAKFYLLRALPQQDQLDDAAQAQRSGREILPGRRLSQEFVEAYQRLRDDAAYWLGLVWLEQKQYKSAMQYFDKMTLQADPDGPWSNGARFNLARCYEAEGNLPEAIKLYQGDKSPQRYGNRLRAERLKAQAKP